MSGSLRDGTAAGRVAVEVGACAKPDAPPSRRGRVAYLIEKTGRAIGGWRGYMSGFRT